MRIRNQNSQQHRSLFINRNKIYESLRHILCKSTKISYIEIADPALRVVNRRLYPRDRSFVFIIYRGEDDSRLDTFAISNDEYASSDLLCTSTVYRNLILIGSL